MHSPHPEPQTSESTTPAARAAADAPVAGEFGRLALWMAGSLAGLMTAVLVSQGPFFQSLAARAGAAKRGTARGPSAKSPAVPKPTPEQALPMLTEAIVGNSKAAVASVFGPPRGAVVRGVAGLAGTYWDADTWYYALPRGERTAIVIDFAEDYAANVTVLVSEDGG